MKHLPMIFATCSVILAISIGFYSLGRLYQYQDDVQARINWAKNFCEGSDAYELHVNTDNRTKDGHLIITGQCH